MEEAKKLQDYAKSPMGPNHPSKAKLDELREGDTISGGRVIYYKNKQGEVTVLKRNHHQADVMKGTDTYVYCAHPQMPRVRLENNSELLDPHPRMKEELLIHDRLFLPAERVHNMEHSDVDSCHCGSTACEVQVQGVTDSICYKKQYLSREEAVTKFDFSEDKFKPNATRAYLYSARSKKPVLVAPSPFLLAWQWPAKHYIAANALEPISLKTDLFYSTLQLEQFKENVLNYSKGPGEWDETTHPLFSEPLAADELHAHSKMLHSKETLHRTAFAQHPARARELRIVCCMDAAFLIPVLTNNGNKPDIIENYIAEKLRPFYSEGRGQAPCAVCIMTIKDSEFSPSIFTRCEYVQHFKSKHQKNIDVTGLAFETGYNTRLYQAQVVYLMCLAIQRSYSKDEPERGPFAEEDKVTEHGMKVDSSVQRLLANNGQQELIELHRKNPQFGYAEGRNTSTRRRSKETKRPVWTETKEDQPLAGSSGLEELRRISAGAVLDRDILSDCVSLISGDPEVVIIEPLQSEAEQRPAGRIVRPEEALLDEMSPANSPKRE